MRTIEPVWAPWRGPRGPRGPRDPRGRRGTADSLLALAAMVVLGIVSVVMGVGASLTDGAGSWPAARLAVAATATIAMPVALAWRRTRPAGSAIVIYAGALVHFLAGALWLPVDVLVLVSLYSVTIYGPRWARRAGLAGALLGAALIGVAMGGGWDGRPPGPGSWTDVVSWTFTVAGMVFATWALALARRSRIERIDRLIERTHRLEVERDQQIQLATAAERTRIAREMHDVVAHSLSVVIAQADGGRYAARTDPAAAERVLATIARTGRDALADTRRILGVLRTENGDLAANRPQPVAGDLDELVAQVRA
ncbi:sensor histidine kinase, partial [Georgenia sp.]